MSAKLNAAHGYVWANGARRVHYRTAGYGAPIVLLHASPVSSASLIDRVEAFAAQGAQAIAIDTPGYGESDGLGLERPDLADYASALADTLNALGLQRVVLYGRHTGAAIGAQFAALYPDRVALLYCDGYPVYDESTRTRYRQRYVSVHPHDFTGSHLIWAWNRYREQFVHWPWFEQNPSHRADTDMPSLAALHRGTLDLLAAGENYGHAEAAVFGTETGPLLAAVQTPTIVSARQGDALLKRVSVLDRFGTFDVRPVPRAASEAMASEWRSIAPFLDATRRGGRRHTSAPAGQVERRMIGDTDAAWCVRTCHPPGAGAWGVEHPPLVLLPDGPFSGQALEPRLKRHARSRSVWAADWPGAGNTEEVDTPATQVEAAVRLLELLGHEGIGRFDLQGMGVGAWIAREIARLAPQRVRSLRTVQPTIWPSTAASTYTWLPDLVPTPEGAHLMRAWQYLRDSRLWSPWFDRRRAQRRIASNAAAVDVMDRELLAVLQQPARVAGFEGWYAECHHRLPPERRHPESEHRD